MDTPQMQAWEGQFGKEYTDRNALTLEETDSLYLRNYGVTRTEMNDRFLGNLSRGMTILSRGMTILEVGSNTGTQLLFLQKAGFKNLYGIDANAYAVELSKARTKGINIILGSGFGTPFKDGFFDMVFTSGLLIHIAPTDIAQVLDEIYRCTKRYIWCFEYFAPKYMEVAYRGHNDLLWKANFCKMFLERFSGLKLVKEERFGYLDSDNVDTMFLLEKGGPLASIPEYSHVSSFCSGTTALQGASFVPDSASVGCYATSK